MALSEQSRNQMYQYFSTTDLGEKVTSEMLSYFPARDVEEPITKADLREEGALIRLEFHNEMTDLRDDLRTEFRTELSALRSDLRSEFRADLMMVRDDLRTEIGSIDQKVDALDQKVDVLADTMRSEMRQLHYWLAGTQIAVIGIVLSLVVTLH